MEVGHAASIQINTHELLIFLLFLKLFLYVCKVFFIRIRSYSNQVLISCVAAT